MMHLHAIPTHPVRVGQMEADVEGTASGEGGKHGVVSRVWNTTGPSCSHVVQEVVVGLSSWREGQRNVTDTELHSYEK